jgi:hypothetical protein
MYLRFKTHMVRKSKAIPVTGRRGLQGCVMLRFAHCLANRFTDGDKVVSPKHRPRSTSQKCYFSASDTSLNIYGREMYLEQTLQKK